MTAPKLPEGLEPVAWTEKQTMTAIKTAKTWGTVKLTREVGPYDIDVPTFDASLLALAIVAARDVQWDAALQALAAEKDSEIAALKAQLKGWLVANGRGGWIDRLRNQAEAEAIRAAIAKEKQ